MKCSLDQGVTSQGQYVVADPGCKDKPAKRKLQQTSFYVCPRDGRNKNQAYHCGGPESLYCKQWSCETTGNAYWRPSSSWGLITLTRGNKGEDSFNITFTQQGWKFANWPTGRTWGLWFYMTGWDKGFTFQIRLNIATISTQAIGPNPVLPNLKGPTKIQNKAPQVSRQIPLTPASSPFITFTSTDPRFGRQANASGRRNFHGPQWD